MSSRACTAVIGRDAPTALIGQVAAEIRRAIVAGEATPDERPPAKGCAPELRRLESLA